MVSNTLVRGSGAADTALSSLVSSPEGPAWSCAKEENGLDTTKRFFTQTVEQVPQGAGCRSNLPESKKGLDKARGQQHGVWLLRCTGPGAGLDYLCDSFTTRGVYDSLINPIERGCRWTWGF